MPTAKTSVNRSLSGSRIGLLVPQPVADAANGLEGGAPEGPIDFVPEVADIDVDNVRVAIECEVPHMLEQTRAGQRLPRVLHEVVKERELLSRQAHWLAATQHRMIRRIESEIAYLENRRPSPWGSTDQ